MCQVLYIERWTKHYSYPLEVHSLLSEVKHQKKVESACSMCMGVQGDEYGGGDFIGFTLEKAFSMQSLASMLLIAGKNNFFPQLLTAQLKFEKDIYF